MITLFQGHKDLLLLTLTDSSPAVYQKKNLFFLNTIYYYKTLQLNFFFFLFKEILVHIFQDNCLKERQLNKLCYRKKLKMKKIFELKVIN